MEVFTKLCKPSINIVPYLFLRRYCSNTPTIVSIGSELKGGSELPFSRDGDQGCTNAKGVSLSKDNRIFEAIGATDELLSYLGLAREFAIANHHSFSDKLTRIQTMLVDITLAITKSNTKVPFPQKNAKELEEWITDYSKNLAPAENYLLPGGGKAATSLHVARSICRRAERTIIPLVNEGEVDQQIQIYFNRLADLLFTLARFAARREERSESVYTPLSEQKKKTVAEEQKTTENTKDINNKDSS